MPRSVRRRAASLVCASLVGLAWWGCSGRRATSDMPARSTGEDSTPRLTTTGAPDAGQTENQGASKVPSTPGGAVSSEPREEDGVLFVDDPKVLAALEEGGASLGAVLAGTTEGPVDNGVLAKIPRYASLVQVLEADIDEIARSDPRAGVSVARYSHRLFDKRWLRSPSAHFELVGLVNRLDRAGIVGGCGEVRLVYRLGYDLHVNRDAIASRLPMTLSLELAVRPDAAGGDPANVERPASPAVPTCRSAAQRWFPPPPEREGARLARWLLSERGPLFAEQRAPLAIRRVAVNMQSVRWPSTVRPDLGGHAEYVLRAFADDGAGRLGAAPLENTLDVARASRGTPLFQKLRRWVSTESNLSAIDGATIVLPDELSAKRVVSVTPRGLARQKNRPFSTILRTSDIPSLPLGSLSHAQSPAAFLRRLDDLTCSGCHESRSVAGFHFLGIDREGTAPTNALAAPFSPHFASDQPRRRQILRALREGRTPSFARPFAERAARGDAGYGAHCGLGDPGFADWKCDAGYRCDPFDAAQGDTTVGVCLPENGGGVGDPCEVGPIAPNADPLHDRVARARASSCAGDAACNTNAVGFPGGMCTPSCGALSPAGSCGAIAILDAFNACLAQSKSFETCITQHSSPAGLRRCSRDQPCRDDYICAGGGVCIPPYFVFQMRVDGHPVPPPR